MSWKLFIKAAVIIETMTRPVIAEIRIVRKHHIALMGAIYDNNVSLAQIFSTVNKITHGVLLRDRDEHLLVQKSKSGPNFGSFVNHLMGLCNV